MKRGKIDPLIFWPSIITIVGVTLPMALNPEKVAPFVKAGVSFINNQVGWGFELLALGTLAFLIWLAAGRYGRVKLGTPDAAPEFTTASWVAMIFCAGMGSSILYWSMMEPIYYMSGPPFGIAPNSAEAREWSTAYAMFHWGVVGWGIYALPTLVIGYSFHVRKQVNLRISVACRGILGRHADGWVGKVIDILVIWGLVGSLGTSLGLGAPMVSAVVGKVLGVERTLVLDMAVVLVWVVIFSTSVSLGLSSGIKKLSDINMYLVYFFAAFVLLAGPTLFIFSNFTNSLGLMLQNFFRMSLWTDPVAKGGFPQSWTMFYWAWWVACTPFMGLFVARISRGRTLREIIQAMLVWGPLGGWVYIAIFGGYAIHLESGGILAVTKVLAEKGGPATVVALIDTLPLAGLIFPLFAVLAFIFLATSLDSACFVLASIATRDLGTGDEPALWHRLFWAAILGLMAFALMAIGGLKVVQTSAVLAALPMAVVFLLMLFSLHRWLKEDHGHAADRTGVPAESRAQEAAADTSEEGDAAQIAV